jgi:hypothetical protein
MEENVNDIETVSHSKKERSSAYPAKTIEDSLALVRSIYKNFRSDFVKRDDILDIVEEASHPRDIAAATYYTLLNRVKDTYQVTELYKEIDLSIKDEEKNTALLFAFKAPKFNNELIQKFNKSEVPKELVIHLHRFHGITQDAAPLAADIFIKNATFCHVLNDKNILDIDNPVILKEEKTKEGKEENFISNTITVEKNNNDIEKNAVVKPLVLIEEMVDAEETKIRLTGGRFCILKHPSKLSSKDIEILKKQIEMLELLVE